MDAQWILEMNREMAISVFFFQSDLLIYMYSTAQSIAQSMLFVYRLFKYLPGCLNLLMREHLLVNVSY